MSNLNHSVQSLLDQNGWSDSTAVINSSKKFSDVNLLDPTVASAVHRTFSQNKFGVSRLDPTTLRISGRQGGDLGSDILRDGEELRGPTDDGLEEKVKEWRAYVKDHATAAGFRKAHLRDPRRFALRLAEITKQQALRYHSKPLARLSKQLKSAAQQRDPKVVNALLKKIAEVDEIPFGNPRVEKPNEKFTDPDTPASVSTVVQSSKARSRKNAKRRDLQELADDFITQYQSANSLDQDDLAESLQDPEIYESWMVDLDSKGVNPDPDEVDHAWQSAINEILDDRSDSDVERESSAERPRARSLPQSIPAPGGDWFNNIVRSEETPVVDRYLKKMRAKAETNKKTNKKKDVELLKVIDQFLDEFAGEMTPGDIAPQHVKEFVNENYPTISWKKVYKKILEITDVKRRNEENERLNEDKPKATANVRRFAAVPLKQLASDNSETSLDFLTHSRMLWPRLQGKKQICASCHGTGHAESGCCGNCGGSGRKSVQLHASPTQLQRQDKTLQRLGTLLLVAVQADRLSRAARNALQTVIPRRASRQTITRHLHSPQLMQILHRYDIPYQEVNYTHPDFKRKIAMNTNTCELCGEHFYTNDPETTICPTCVEEPQAQRNRDRALRNYLEYMKKMKEKNNQR